MKRTGAPQVRRPVALAGVVGLLVIAALVLAGVSSSATVRKYSASITPTAAVGGTQTSFTVTITNSASSTGQLGSANATFPAGFTLPQGAVPSGSITAPAGKTWTATVVGNVVQLRNPGPGTSKALAPGQSVSVTLAQVGTPASCGSYSLSTQAKPSNDLSGGAGDNFTRVGPEPSVTVSGTAVASFTWTTEPGANQVAGVAFGAQITAKDACGNVAVGYTGTNATFSGLGTSPNGNGPSYSVTWSNGVGTATFVDNNAETGVAITITDGSVQATSSPINVAAAAVSSLTWTQQPQEALALATLTPAPAVTATDAFGNPISGANVSLGLTAISGTGTFTGGSTTTATTDSSGVATFPNLAITDIGQYQLLATSGSVSQPSNAFVIANQLNPCSGTCSASGSTSTTTTNVSVTGAPPGSFLGVSVIPNDTVPAGVCGGFGFFQLGAGSFVNIVNSGGVTPTFTITWTLDKSVVDEVGDPADSQFDVCLGAESLLDPMGLTTVGWTTKLGTPAQGVLDPSGDVLFWGIVPDCPSLSSGPCVQSRHKVNGNEVITFLKPSPWDGHYFGGGP